MAKTTIKTTLADTIYFKIREEITQHNLRPGDKINIKELAKQFGVSETPVKFALNRLISENIIDNFPRQGMRVHGVTAQEVDEIFDARLMLDLYQMKQVIMTVTFNNNLKEEMYANIEEHLELVTNLCPESPVEDYIRNYDLDLKFHELYLKCTGNHKLLDIFNYINPFLYSNFIFKRQSKNKDVSGVLEHKMIYEAIINEDEVSLQKALTIHNINAKTAIGLILKVDQLI
ncbi:GntR family transcriptional regulator [Chakrabartyella piscis]|uniref:GntR family transcriptional regulator n=1 Tax=Chakrabartyella piscis TaxID=2918914 RepID=UPI0029583FD3|nr:GntR family transcriptional regulator [Chakrabartyella piscis]